MGNLDFSNEPGFSWYCVLLLISGIAMLGMVGVPVATKGARIVNLVFGIGFTAYAIYLIFLFHGGHYVVFFKAFLLPVFLIVGTIRSGAMRRTAKNAVPYQPPMMNYGENPDQRPGYAPQQQGYAPQQQGYAPHQGFVPQQHQGFAPQQPYAQQADPQQAYGQQQYQQPQPPQ